MDKSIQQLLNEKYENVVQFNLTNTTGQNQFVNFFDTNTLTGISFNPSPTNLANTNLGSFSYPFFGGRFAFNTSNGDIFIGNPFSNIVYVYDSNFTPITSIVLGLPFVNTTRQIVYNPNSNTMYVIPVSVSAIRVIDCSTYTILTTIIPPISGYSAGIFCPSNNSIYITENTGFVIVIDSSLSVSLIPVSPQPFCLVFDSVQNRIYFADNITVDINYIDCATNTFVPISIPLPLLAIVPQLGLAFNPINNQIYCPFGIGNTIDIFDTSTNTFLPSVSFSVLSVVNTIIYDSNNQSMYASYVSSQVVNFNPITNTEIAVLNPTFFGSYNLGFNPLNNQLGLITHGINIFELFTTANVYSVPFYITGSSNYNSFVNNLNNEPIYIQMIRLLAQNQNQLTNEVQFTTIDSNGNQIFMPNFPINQVSPNQQQGNISEISMKNTIFDGRTYINQYQLNPFETISIEVYYKQLDLMSASRKFPIMFKPKIQLAEYLKLK